MRPGVQSAMCSAHCRHLADAHSASSARRATEKGALPYVSLVELDRRSGVEAAEYLETGHRRSARQPPRSPRPTSCSRPATSVTSPSARPPIRCRQAEAGARARRASRRPALCLLFQAKATRTRSFDRRARRARTQRRRSRSCTDGSRRALRTRHNFEKCSRIRRSSAAAWCRSRHPRLGRMRTTRNPVLLTHDGPHHRPARADARRTSQRCSKALGYSPEAIGKVVTSGVTKLANMPMSSAKAGPSNHRLL